MDAKACLRALTLELRRELEGSYDREGAWKPGDLEVRLASIGVRRDRAPKPLAELSHLPPEDKQARQAADAFLASRAEAGLGAGDAVVELVRASAYTWANRLLALRAMEARGLIDEVILQKDAYGGRSLQHHRLTKKDPARCSGPDEGIFAVLFDEFGRRAGELESLFDPAAPEVALRPSVPAIKRCLALLSGSVAPRGQDKATDEVFTAPDALGWAYQYWNSEEKERVFAAAAGKGPDRKKHKIEGAEIVPATCFYTDAYMVSFLVQNSLGALWAAMEPGSRLVAGWDYYVHDADRTPVTKKPVREITFLDPACGSGHFLIEAFDLLYAMYVEEGAITGPAEICASILEHNLYGIDIDQRAVQLAGLALVMKAKEKAPDFSPRRINLVATNIRLPGAKGHLEAFLKKHPEDEALRPALLAVFEALAHADELGSLLQVEEPVDRALRELEGQAKAAKSWPGQMTLIPGAAKAKQGELPLGVVSYEAWKGRTLERLRDHFEAEARVPDLGQALFGQAATKGISMVEVLSRRYDVVAANPPYMGSKNMGPRLKKYVERHFKAGKRDLYATFILRCLELSNSGGRVAVVAQQSWMFLRSYAELRAMSDKKIRLLEERFATILALTGRPATEARFFHGMLHDMTLEAIAHLGRYAFSDIGNAAVMPVMFVAQNAFPNREHKIWACRLTAPRASEEQASLLRGAAQGRSSAIVFRPKQNRFLRIPQSPVSYWLRERFFELLADQTLSDVGEALQGLSTANDPRFVRFTWEAPPGGWSRPPATRRWAPFEKGGGYGKWYGHHFWVVDWESHGKRVSQYTIERHGSAGKCVRNDERYFDAGWTYSYMASGSLALRRLSESVFSHLASGVFFRTPSSGQAALLNCRLSSMIVRSISAKMQLNESYVLRVPMADQIPESLAEIEPACVQFKRTLVATDPTERSFAPKMASGASLHNLCCRQTEQFEAVAASLHALEGTSEREAFAAYEISGADLQSIIDETGCPVGWFDLVVGYDNRLPVHDEPALTQRMVDVLATGNRRLISEDERHDLKLALGASYVAGPGAKTRDDETDLDAGSEDEEDEEDDSTVAAAHVPVPAETFLEELSQKFEIHPISVYWLLRELREKDGVVCLPELRRFVEDHFSVLILRLLGHQWPKQIEAREPLPSWADADGVVPLVEGAGEDTLLARLRDRIGEDFGAERVSAIEQEFQEIMGKPLAAWIAADFFKRHVSQFKRRPIAWQIESHSTAPASKTRGKSKTGGGATRRVPAFSCLVYYHRVDADLLPKLRTQYVGPLQQRLRTEHDRLERITLRSDEQDARRGALQIQIEELKDFDGRLASVIESGFSSASLDAIAEEEPIDAWTSRDGTASPPATGDAFLAQERHYDPDLNDGVRVNVAPLQKAGLLAAEVIAPKDLDKAIADRADWRADERRWCREGKLPRPGWWTMLPPDDP